MIKFYFIILDEYVSDVFMKEDIYKSLMPQIFSFSFVIHEYGNIIFIDEY